MDFKYLVLTKLEKCRLDFCMLCKGTVSGSWSKDATTGGLGNAGGLTAVI